MKLIRLWEKYFLKEMLKVFLLFICGFYFLYVLIDYTSRTGSLLGNSVGLKEVGIYYLLTFLKRIDLLFPFGLMIATITALISLNSRRELVALLAGGVPFRRLLRPFLFAGIACSALMYLNFQVFSPLAWRKIQQIEDSHHSEGGRQAREMGVQDIRLADGSFILCQSYDSARKLFFDAFWVRSIDEVWRIKYLYPDSESTVGRFVDLIKRNEEGVLELTESYETKVLSELQFDEENLQAALRTPEELSITELWSRLPFSVGELTEKQASVVALFYSRLATPLLCILAVMAPTPFCVRFSRQLPVLLIFISGIVGIAMFYLLMDAALIIARGQVIPPSLAIFSPYALYFWVFVRRYLQL